MKKEEKKILTIELTSQVAGGIKVVETKMICRKPGCLGGNGWIKWAGDFSGKGPYQCPFCKENTLYGTSCSTVEY